MLYYFGVINMNNVNIIAHRGASALAKQENTLEAFLIAIKLKADYAEFDIRKTFDGKFIVFHNDTIDDKLISSITYEELEKIAHSHGYRVPLLIEVLKTCKGKIKLDIELKESGYEKEIINLVKSMYDYDEFMMKSFIDSAVRRIKKYDPQIRTGLLLGCAHADLPTRFNELFPVRRVKRCRADFISPYYRICNNMFLRRMERVGLPVYVWTVNSPKVINHFLDTSVTGIITDKPDAALYLRSEKNKSI